VATEREPNHLGRTGRDCAHKRNHTLGRAERDASSQVLNRLCNVMAPAGARRLSIEGLGSVDPVGYVSSAGGVSRVHPIGTGWQSHDHLSCEGGQTVEVIIGNAFRDHPPRQPASAPLRAYARRAAVEARDRLRPIMR
jgi:hypothetical protein